MHDVAFYLETLSGVSTSMGLAAPLQSQKSRFRGWIPWILTLLTILGSATWMLTPKGASPLGTEADSQRFAIQLSVEQELGIGGNSLLTFSPDGRSLVFSGIAGGRRMLLLRRLEGPQPIEISGTEDGEAPFFSPDGRWLGFTARGQLLKVPIEGGRPIRLGNARGAGGATWLGNGKIIFAPIYSDGLFRVAAEGGTPERLTTPDRDAGVLGHWWPDLLPGSRWIIFTAFRTPVDTSRIGALNLETREIHWLVDGGFFGRYVKPGYLLYAKGQRLYALPLDAENATARGTAVPVLEDLLVEQTGGFAMFAVSDRGMLAYVTESLGHPLEELVWLDRTGRPTQAVPEKHRYLTVALAPDGQRAALTLLAESRDLWIYSFERGTLSRLTSGDDTEFDPVWAHNGNELFYVVDRPPFTLYRIGDGTPDAGKPVWKERAERDTLTPTVSPNGRTLVYTLSELETGIDIYSRLLDGSEPPRPFRATRSTEDHPSFSPDGQWLAYQSDETGRPEVYVEAFPGPGERFQVSADGGREPKWAGDGELFFRHENEMRVVTTRLQGRFEFDAPHTLFTFPLLTYSSGGVSVRLYDVTADGKRILSIATPATLRPRQIDVATNWTNDLARLAPIKAQ